MNLTRQLEHAVTQFDRMQEHVHRINPKRYYNQYALGIYLRRVDDVVQAVNKGANLKDTLSLAYNGALLSFLLKHFKL